MDMQMLMNVEEVAKFLRKGKNYVYAEIKAGRLPAIKLGRTLRIKRDSLLMWLNQCQECAVRPSDI